MKNKTHVLFLVILIGFQFCKAQQAGTVLPKIENYTKGELEIRVTPFGADKENEIKVGHISLDGSIHFKWPEIDLANYKASDLLMNKLDFLLGMYNCNDEKIEDKNEEIKAADTKFLLLYNKYGDFVGSLHPSTHKEIRNSHGSIIVGSYFTWFYSNGDGKLNAVCTRYNRLKDSDEFDKNSIYNTKTFNINFKKGWNLVEHKLLEVKDQEWNGQIRSTRYKEQKISLSKMPNTVNWHLKYSANDEYLKIERELPKKEPITKEEYENWLPKKLGKLKRTQYEIGKTLEKKPTLNNIEMRFENGPKKATVTIIDCTNNNGAASFYTLILDMLSRDWKDKTDTGYNTATKLDNNRVMIEYNEKETKTKLTFYANERLVIEAEATSIKPQELWEKLKSLNLKKLIKK